MSDGVGKPAGLSLRRAAPLLVIVAGAVAAALTLGDALSFEALARHREALVGWRDGNYPLAAAGFVAVYALAVAFSAPGAVWFTLAGGLMFGTAAGGMLVVVAATTGAFAIYTAARAGLGDALRARAGGWLDRARTGFSENAVSYMLAMRLTPVVPFFVANLAPAFLGVRPLTYLWTTFVGIMPATFVYASIGAGLGAVIDRGEQPDLGVIFDWRVLGPLLGLAALSLAPVALKRLRGR